MTLKQYLKQFKSLCWYPSAGKDFRETMYLSKKFADYKGWCMDTFPDCFILTDYYPWSAPSWLIDALNGRKLLFDDGNTSIEVQSATELEPLDIPFHQSLVDCRKTEYYGRVFSLDLSITSNVLGVLSAKLVYVIAENTAFGIDFLLKNHINVDFIIHVRYGDCLGGGRSSGMFVKRLFHGLKTKYFVSDRNDAPESDSLAFDVYGNLLSYLPDSNLKSLYFLNEAAWSYHGDVFWYEIT